MVSQSEEASGSRRVVARFPRRSVRGRIMGFTDAQLALVGIGIFALIAALWLGNPMIFVPVLVAIVALAPTWFTGRPIIAWTPLVGAYAVRAVRRQTRYRAKPLAPRPAGTLGLPGDGARLRVLVERATGAGLIHDPSKRTLTAFMRVRPAESFALAEGTKQDTVADGWASLLSGFCTDTSGGISRVTALLRAVSDGGQEISGWLQEAGSPDLSQEAYEAYAEYVGVSRTEAMRHEAYVGITLDMNRRNVASMIRQAGGGVAGGAVVLRTRMDFVATQLTNASLVFEGWQGSGDVCRLARIAYEPDAQGELEAHPGTGEVERWAGPLAVDEAFTWFRTEGGYHRVMLVTEWPRKETTAGFLQQLVVAQVRHTFALVHEPIPPRKAIADARRESTQAETSRMWQAKSGGLDLVEHQEERKSLAREERALEAGAGALNFAGLVTVSADSLDELRLVTEQVKTAAARSTCVLRILGGQQCSAFIAGALPFGRGL